MNILYVYILRCSDDSYYIGQTDNIEIRLHAHRLKQYSCYTNSRLPVELVFIHECSSRDEAVAMERQIKKWSRKKKEALIKGKWDALRLLAKKQFNRTSSVA